MADEAQGTQYSHMAYGEKGNIFSERTALVDAAFFLPHIRSGMSLLDCGCGSGSITLGLAEAVAPGEVAGFDVGEAPIQHARNLAKEKGVSNVKFDVGNIYEIPFEDASFDAVFSHNVFEHLGDHAGALGEMYRVLKPGGVIGVAAQDFDGAMFSHSDDPLHELREMLKRVWEHNNGRRFGGVGKHLGELLCKAGFSEIHSMARINSYGTKEAIETRGNQVLIPSLTNTMNTAAELGWAEPMTREQVAQIWHDFAAKPGAFFSLTFCQAVGWKE